MAVRETIRYEVQVDLVLQKRLRPGEHLRKSPVESSACFTTSSPFPLKASWRVAIAL